MGAQPRRKRVLIACPNGDAYLHKLVVFAVLRMLQDGRHETNFIAPTWSPFVLNLHKIVADVIAQGWDYLLLVDDDNPPLNNPLDLVELDLDVVGLPTPVWHCDTSGTDRPFYFNALRQVEDPDGSISFRPLDSYPEWKGAGLQEADAVGTGCILVARRVLEELARRAEASGDPLDAPFMRMWDTRGMVTMGNDYAFCLRARQAGFRVWVHWDYPCRHFQTIELREGVEQMARAMAPR